MKKLNIVRSRISASIHPAIIEYVGENTFGGTMDVFDAAFDAYGNGVDGTGAWVAIQGLSRDHVEVDGDSKKGIITIQFGPGFIDTEGGPSIANPKVWQKQVKKIVKDMEKEIKRSFDFSTNDESVKLKIKSKIKEVTAEKDALDAFVEFVLSE
ncbi:MAG TPA: hypothetical protein ENI23_12210 [bacterium]|nr:hypothetical protein [bacterium]